MKSTDGGRTWKSLGDNAAEGLPPKPWGRLAVAVAPTPPASKGAAVKRVYLFVESEKSAVYISDDGGASWKRGDDSPNMVWRRPTFMAWARCSMNS